jgi:predicted GNAT family N-acyltransferase
MPIDLRHSVNAPYPIRLVPWSVAQALVAPVREAVFIREQGVPADLEWDDLDAAALHALAEDPSGRVIGTARLLPDGHIGRMAVLVPWRRRGVGSAMLVRLLVAAGDQGLRTARLNAQTQAVAFYVRHGFEKNGGEFLDAGIPHVAMQRHVDTRPKALAVADDSANP